jgi:hypothetical protein
LPVHAATIKATATASGTKPMPCLISEPYARGRDWHTQPPDRDAFGDAFSVAGGVEVWQACTCLAGRGRAAASALPVARPEEGDELEHLAAMEVNTA